MFTDAQITAVASTPSNRVFIRISNTNAVFLNNIVAMCAIRVSLKKAVINRTWEWFTKSLYRIEVLLKWIRGDRSNLESNRTRLKTAANLQSYFVPRSLSPICTPTAFAIKRNKSWNITHINRECASLTSSQFENVTYSSVVSDMTIVVKFLNVLSLKWNIFSARKFSFHLIFLDGLYRYMYPVRCCVDVRTTFTHLR